MSKLSFDVLKNPDFRYMLAARTFGTMALQAQAVIVGWQVYEITHSPFMLGLTGLVEAIPALCSALYAGHLVDVGRPHRMLSIAVACMLLNAIVLFLTAGGLVELPGHHLVWILFAGVFVSGMARSFTIPASFALLPQVAPRKDIPAATAWLTNGFQMGIILGPTLAGIVYGMAGARVAWLIPLCLLAIQFWGIRALSTEHHHFKSGERREPAMQSIREGWRFILRNRVLLAAMSIDMLAVLFGGAVALLPAFADEILHIGSEGLGILRAAPAVGAGLMSLYYAVRPPKQIHARQLLWVMGLFGLCMIGFGYSTNFWLSMLFLVLSGMVDSVGMVIRHTLTQWLTPANMRGRVSSVSSMFIISSNELGAFESGLMASWFGIGPSVVIGGCMSLLVVAIISMASPQLRHTVVDADAEART